MLNKSIDQKENATNDFSKKTGVTYYVQRALFIIKATSRVCPNRFIGAVRSDVACFSIDSSRRMRRYLRCCVPDYRYMLTLTYPGFFSSDGSACKQHLRQMLQELKREQERFNTYKLTGADSTRKYSSFWFLEFQERGAPHFHILTTHEFNKQWLSRRWFDIVGSDDLRHLAAGTNFEKLRQGRAGICSYATKYANKQSQKVVPDGYENVGRFWGVSGSRATVAADTFLSREDMAKPAIKSSLKRFKAEFEEMKGTGKAVLLSSNDGARVYKLTSLDVQERVYQRVMYLGLHSGKTTNIFSSAEVDNG